MTKLAFLGLGVMGYPMAGHLFNAGHNVKVYNRTQVRLLNGLKNMVAIMGKHLQRLQMEWILSLLVLEMMMT